jgi:hypothetical protein
MYDPGNVMRQTSADVHSVKESPFYLYQQEISAVVNYYGSL